MGTANWLPIGACEGVLTLAMSLWQALEGLEQAHVAQVTHQAAVTIKQQMEVGFEAQFSALKRMGRRWEMRRSNRAMWEADSKNYVQDVRNTQAVEWVDNTFHVRWIVPLKGNERAKDLYLGFESRRRAALEAARDRRMPTVSRVIDLVQGVVFRRTI